MSSLRVALIWCFGIARPCFYFRNLSTTTDLMVLESLSLRRLNLPEFTNSVRNISLRLLISFSLRVDMLLRLECRLSSWCSFYLAKQVMYSCEMARMLRHSSVFKTSMGLAY